MSELDTKSIGKKIKSYRVNYGWSQQECAEKMGISVKYLSYIETGAKVPKLETLLHMLNVLQASADDVLQDSLVVGYQAKSNDLSRKLETMDIAQRNQAVNVLQFVIEAIEKSL